MKFATIVALLVSAVAVSGAAIPQEESQSYIVVFKSTTTAEAIEQVEKDIVGFGGKIGQHYDTVLKGFSAWIPTQVVSTLSASPFIAYIEEDAKVTTQI
ncbi:hypothetical protein BGZ80_002178 [Entomortierella chlamydospora]|uniref:Inhibitor I9 domain-containing protein n=1 Tax=Entomortierella chlamydospora TaxID=101097 RepID=A0A9P6N1X8_9FUNG|nr:hypothetical protein BGZ79_010636 [Entomortierella chlamydospora]KAG0021544.1 hypothetical protein BGZ80_002178 [Entomortierella chlamydospora]